MEYMTSHDIRKKFLDYFSGQHHHVVPSSSLIPGNDPTLLFTNAGMVQFKDIFLGVTQSTYKRAASIQRCLRAGGKHNDLENVGYTARHHTFFEMLGNFSFGDYFKTEAITFAWQFLTEVLGLPTEKLWITVFKEDTESETIWLEKIGVDPARLSRCDEKDNFWQMGETGPCGPCTEIFYDHGPSICGGPPGTPDAEGDRFVEIWNVVFMQYDRHTDGRLTPLPKPCVDTGMGLERLAAVLQGVHDNYDTDLFQFLLKALSSYVTASSHQEKSMRVIADHIRSSSFLIVDGILPSNEGRGYVLRRIIRRALRHGAQLGQEKPFFYKMVAPLVHVMGEAYPALKKSEALVKKIIFEEEEQFAKTLTRGLKKLEEAIQAFSPLLPGDIVFQLYDTYGFPPDLTADIARERGVCIDHTGFEIAMENQRALSQKAQHFSIDHTKKITINHPTNFIGYDHEAATAEILGLYTPDFHPVSQLAQTERGIVVLNQTPFYAEGGGQIGDSGMLLFSGGCFTVLDTQKQGEVYLHSGYIETGVLRAHQTVEAVINREKRQAIRCHHTATHLLHAALRHILGEQVGQKGSWVSAERLRFDFSHTKPVSAEQLMQIEQKVNAEIRANTLTETTTMSPIEAQSAGAIAFFNERYGDHVRVLKVGTFSLEICGGTHVRRTGDIGLFKIISESACSAGVRRMEAVAGSAALAHTEKTESTLRLVGQLLKTSGDDIHKKVVQLLEKNTALEQSVGRLQQQYAHSQCTHARNAFIKIGDIHCLAWSFQDITPDILRNTLDYFRETYPVFAIILSSVCAEKIHFVAAVSTTCLPYFNAVALLQHVAHQVGGQGGGRPEMAQGSGVEIEWLPRALQSVPDWIKQWL